MNNGLFYCGAPNCRGKYIIYIYNYVNVSKNSNTYCVRGGGLTAKLDVYYRHGGHFAERFYKIFSHIICLKQIYMFDDSELASVYSHVVK